MAYGLRAKIARQLNSINHSHHRKKSPLFGDFFYCQLSIFLYPYNDARRMRHPYPVEILLASIIPEFLVVACPLRFLEIGYLVLLERDAAYLHLEADGRIGEVLAQELFDAPRRDGCFTFIEYAGERRHIQRTKSVPSRTTRLYTFASFRPPSR